MTIQSTENLRRAFQRAYDPVIKSIRFPSYKNLNTNLQIDFTYPITALVGGNGTNKTSILRAIEACPEGYDLGNWWFSTSMDPIPPGAHPRYIYAYSMPGQSVTAEVRKARIERSSRRQDYFETTKPADGMARMPSLDVGRDYRVKTRWKPVQKSVLYIDFRAELPAYEKYMQHPSGKEIRKDLESRKGWVRVRSRKVRGSLDSGGLEDSYYGVPKVHEIVSLSDNGVAAVSRILGRVYSSIRMIRHDYFGRPGWTIELRNEDRIYSEAYAGSGEFAIVVMVHQVLDAEDRSMILLDEPETSLHPASQERLIEFLLAQSIKRKHQIVFATHSPHMIRPLPDDAIKLLTLDPVNGKVRLDRQSNSQSDAFFRLGAPMTNQVTVFVEDKLAAEILKLAIRPLGEALYSRIDIRSYPGGAGGMVKRLIPQLAQTSNGSSLVLLDGDMLPKNISSFYSVDERRFVSPEVVPDSSLAQIFDAYFQPGPIMELAVDGSGGTREASSDLDGRKEVLKWVYKNVAFLPGLSPEELLCASLGVSVSTSSEAKKYFADLAVEELNVPAWDSQSVTSDDIFQIQRRVVAKMNVEGEEWDAIRIRIENKINSLS